MAGSWVLNGSRHMLQASSELSSKAAEDDGVEMCDIVRVRGKGEEEVKFAISKQFTKKGKRKKKGLINCFSNKKSTYVHATSFCHS